MAVPIQYAPFRVRAASKLFELAGSTYNFDLNFADTMSRRTEVSG